MKVKELLKETPKYAIFYDKKEGIKCIQCKTCKKTSYHPKDVEKLYCANCDEFHINGLY